MCSSFALSSYCAIEFFILTVLTKVVTADPDDMSAASDLKERVDKANVWIASSLNNVDTIIMWNVTFNGDWFAIASPKPVNTKSAGG